MTGHEHTEPPACGVSISMKRNTEAECGSCPYFWQTSRDQDGDGFGFCRRFPPSERNDVGPEYIPRTVHSFEVCGEHPDFFTVPTP